MATSQLDSMVPEREYANFAARCRRQGFQPEQFRILPNVPDLPVAESAPTTRQIDVTHIGYACQRRYRTDPLSDWLDAFERDLRNGFFYGW